MRRLLHTILAISLALTLVAPALPAAAAPAFTDMAGHWAGQWVEPWASLGLINGYPDGTFGPGRPITRAEMCALINRALGLDGSSVELDGTIPGSGGAWYEQTIAVALAAGYVEPCSDGLVQPDAALSRQELATLIALALKLQTFGTIGALSRFGDESAVEEQYRSAVAAMVDLGHLRGFEDGTLRPAQTTTRAEALALLARTLGALYRTAGEFGPAAGDPEFLPGSAVVAAPGVTLRNVVIPGDLYVTAAALGGVTRLTGVAVIGTLYVSGGSQVAIDGSRVARLVIDRGLPVAVQTTGESYVSRTIIRSDAVLSESELTTDGFVEVVVAAPGGIDVSLDGIYDKVRIGAPDSALNLSGGTIGELTVLAEQAAIDLAEGTEAGSLFLHGRTAVTGAGSVASVAAFAAGVDLGVEPGRLTVSPGVVTMVRGKAYTGELIARREYTFAEDEAGWAGGFCDYPVETDPAEWGLEFGHADLPEEIGPGKGLLIAGNNHSDDLFMFLARRLGTAEGLMPDTAYTVEVEFDLGTDAPAGAVGIGGAPGESVHVKVGAAGEQPRPVEDDNGYWRLSVDKGSQNDEGRNAVLVGDVAKAGAEFDGYELKTLTNAGRPLVATTDAEGNLWVFVGTDSGFEGNTALYYTRIQVTLSVTQAE